MPSTPTDPAPAPEAAALWDCSCSQQGEALQPRLRPPSRTTSLPFKQAQDLINGLAFAESFLLKDTPWAHVVMVLDQSEDFEPDPRVYLALQGRILHRVGGWLRSRGLPGHFLWVREIGPRYGQQHTHLLLPLPPELGEDLAALIRRVGRLQDTSNNPAVYVQLNRRQGNTGIITLASRAGIMRDFLKTMSPKAKLQGIPIMPALALDNRKQKPCTVYGKRSGTSASLGRAARAAAGWRELVTLAELRAALPTGAEARRDRNQQRRRARRAAGPLPSTLPARSRSTDPFDATGLEADFLDDFVRVC